VLLFLSLSFLTTVSGQISLAHSAFLAIGAMTMSHLTVESYGATGTGNIGQVAGTGIPWLVALAGAGLLTAVVGGLLALPAMRVTGVYLALATFGFNLLVDNVVSPSGLMFGGGRAGGNDPSTRGSPGSDRGGAGVGYGRVGEWRSPVDCPHPTSVRCLSHSPARGCLASPPE
jgi:ABC-type branched-subunit amino acid transport system permease subunit